MFVFGFRQNGEGLEEAKSFSLTRFRFKKSINQSSLRQLKSSTFWDCDTSIGIAGKLKRALEA